jgi:hypothetical protein
VHLPAAGPGGDDEEVDDGRQPGEVENEGVAAAVFVGNLCDATRGLLAELLSEQKICISTGEDDRDHAHQFDEDVQAGPLVSLNGSPTVSPTTAALWASVPFAAVGSRLRCTSWRCPRRRRRWPS